MASYLRHSQVSQPKVTLEVRWEGRTSAAFPTTHPNPLGSTQHGHMACFVTSAVLTVTCDSTCGNCLSNIIYKYCAWCIFGCLCVLDQVGGWGFFVFSICIMCKQNSWVCFESPETISNVKTGFVSARQQQWVCSYWQTSGSPYSLGVWCQQLPARAFQVSRELPLVTLTCRECTAFHEPSTSLVWHLLSEEQGGVSIFLESNERKY